MKAFVDPPAIKKSVVQLQCDSCGAETHAACSCGAIYKPKALERVAEYDKANPGKSERTVAADLGISKTTVHEARESGGHPTDQVTGRDGKTYPAKRPEYTTDEDPRTATDQAPKPEPKSEPKKPAQARLEAIVKLEFQMIDAGFDQMRQRRHGGPQPTIDDLKEARDDLRQYLSSIEYF